MLLKTLSASPIKEIKGSPQKERGCSVTLSSAVEAGDKDTVLHLLQAGAEVDQVSKGGIYTPLELAVKNSHLELAEILIEFGANVNHRGYFGQSIPFELAAQNGNVDMGRLLIKNKANVQVQTISGVPPIFHAIGNGHRDFVLMLLELRYRSLTFRCTDFGRPIDYACKKGDLRIVKDLIAFDHPIEDPNGGLHPIFHAIESNSLDVIGVSNTTAKREDPYHCG